MHAETRSRFLLLVWNSLVVGCDRMMEIEGVLASAAEPTEPSTRIVELPDTLLLVSMSGSFVHIVIDGGRRG
jgi:hypothetical protein